jgi:large subunit ribosomal protein L3
MMGGGVLEQIVKNKVGLIGRKIGMTQIFSEKGDLIPVTVIQAGPCRVVQKKVRLKDGYDAIQLGFEEMKKKRGVKKPSAGHFRKIGLAPLRVLREIRDMAPDAFEVG